MTRFSKYQQEFTVFINSQRKKYQSANWSEINVHGLNFQTLYF